jgi:hypothetical protein
MTVSWLSVLTAITRDGKTQSNSDVVPTSDLPIVFVYGSKQLRVLARMEK